MHDTITERARRRGLDVRPRQIPREVMERQVTEADAVRFFELAHVDLDVRRQGHEARVVLKGFAIPSEDLIPPKVRERMESWSDLIDYTGSPSRCSRWDATLPSGSEAANNGRAPRLRARSRTSSPTWYP